MGKSYISNAGGSALSSVKKFNVKAPFDVRSVVETYDDLYSKDTYSYTEVYVGMLVVVKDTKDLYVCTASPSVRDTTQDKWGAAIKWKKINASEINPADHLSYYQEQLGAKVLNSADGLVGIANPFTGQFAYVKDDPNTSED